MNNFFYNIDNFFKDNLLKFKVNSVSNESLEIKVSGGFFYFHFKNLETEKYSNIIKQLNVAVEDKVLFKEEYFKILNFIACELILSRVNQELFANICKILEEKKQTDLKLAELKIAIK